MTKVNFPKPKKWLNLEISKILYNQFRSSGIFRFRYQSKDKLPPFETRFEGRLESILGSVQLIGDVQQQDLVAVATNLFVSINRGHPFQNGNKRLSIYFLDVFLRVNGFELLIDLRNLEELAIRTNLEKVSDDDIKKIIYIKFVENTFPAKEDN